MSRRNSVLDQRVPELQNRVRTLWINTRTCTKQTRVLKVGEQNVLQSLFIPEDKPDSLSFIFVTSWTRTFRTSCSRTSPTTGGGGASASSSSSSPPSSSSSPRSRQTAARSHVIKQNNISNNVTSSVSSMLDEAAGSEPNQSWKCLQDWKCPLCFIAHSPSVWCFSSTGSSASLDHLLKLLIPLNSVCWFFSC